MSRIELIIFDCDGVLVDSEVIANQVLCEALNQLGLNYTLAKTIDEFVGKRFAAVIDEVNQKLSQPLQQKFWDQLQQRTFARFEDELQAVDGIQHVIKQLTLPFCVASSGSHKKIRHSLRITGLSHYFKDNIYSAEDVSQGKPAPDLFLHVANQYQLAPHQCLVIEDSPAGIQAALSAGMRVFRYGLVDQNQQFDVNVHAVFDKMLELPQLIAAETL